MSTQNKTMRMLLHYIAPAILMVSMMLLTGCTAPGKSDWHAINYSSNNNGNVGTLGPSGGIF